MAADMIVLTVTEDPLNPPPRVDLGHEGE